MKLGVISDCFKRPMAESIAMAGALGLDGIQMYAVGGDICPDALLGNEAKLNEYKELLKKHGLTVSALCGDLGGHGFEREAENAARIEKTCRIVDLALAFDTKVVTTHIGVIPEDETCEKYQTMLKDAEGMLKAGADGIVFGFLNADRTIDLKRTGMMSDLIHSYHKEAVFHKAFDDWLENVAIRLIVHTVFERNVNRVVLSMANSDIVYMSGSREIITILVK